MMARMQALARKQEVLALVKAMLECSVYLEPTDPGLTRDELFEIGARLNLAPGEVGDVLPMAAAQMYFGDKRIMPNAAGMGLWSGFNFPEEPDYRNPRAFDFVQTTLQAIVRTDGSARAQIDRSVLVARAVDTGLPPRDVEVAVTIMLLDEHLTEKDGVLRFARGREMYPTASEQLGQVSGLPFAGRTRRNEARVRAYPVVEDVIGRRTDGRPAAAEPFDAFNTALDRLGYGSFKLWWRQTVSELRRADPSLTPTTVGVLAAALMEGALAFVVKHARALGLGPLGSKDFERPPQTWKIDDLVSSACAGGPSAILDAGARVRADELVRVRQRIHAGRMLSDFPGGAPDLRPDEARAAKATAELVVRRVLDWLEKYPPGSAV
jgi:hypothetical protein